ncbi:MAG: 5-oxoprolinase subunit B family protein [Jatrophihabitans sp.]|uniref:5-oxoprolinase subunit B family protein n=1 Tax=Jatrophihabitans sp. TaxID=1932789 RepID=UPI003F7E57E0
MSPSPLAVRPCGEDGLLLEVGSTAQAIAVAGAVARVPGVVEAVPAARTVLAVLRPGTDPAAVLAAAGAAEARATDGPLVELDVLYDGADLGSTAAELGLSPDELVARHAAVEHVVAFCGFSPGFAYLTGLPPDLRVGRLASPRTAVPAGSVAIAGEYTGVYPRVSPGGWRLLGRTDAPLWDLHRDPPALLAPGTRVRFRPG